MWERDKTLIHDSGFEFGHAGWFAFHAVAIPTMMYIGSVLTSRKKRRQFH
ncbi:hypothetical protein HM1_2493 [Heliomicrobium modesticaldum Ice1]|uniref:Uncharacterized protein n=1 Tax=Heliobacterium modesticaldum (strain ATCC 51547 / Ice1) TaxID=498761 RepID=B0TAJ1_HELMI|nr:hypothetical protein [Heliomicrobium modesticaldum]ABZ85041.1 hypothetical protein HM1_2493 [Heliomicrobium modesticaldum Ice1]